MYMILVLPSKPTFFFKHRKQISLKSIKPLGFLMRSTKSFNNINCLKLIYYNLIRPIL